MITTADFETLAKQWKRDTCFMSNAGEIAAHPAYQAIIAMGLDALPLIFMEMHREPDHWFYALAAITGARPVKPQHRGILYLMTQDWLAWGMENGYA